jgi:hypothetical protein
MRGNDLLALMVIVGEPMERQSAMNVVGNTIPAVEEDADRELRAGLAREDAHGPFSVGGNWFPEFFGIGPARTATTWLHNVLAPHVNLPRTVKETRFLDNLYRRGWRWYRAQFGVVRENLPFGEIAPTYFHSELARERIKELAPGARIICTLRDPVERLYSLYRYLRFRGSYRWSFEYAITHDEEMIESARYAHYVKAWIRDFGHSHVLVTIYDDIARDMQAYIDTICDFIQIPRRPLPSSQQARVNTSEELRAPSNYALLWISNTMASVASTLQFRTILTVAKSTRLKRIFFGKGRELPPIDPVFAADLRRRLTPEIEEVESIIGRDLSAWKA